MRQPLGKRFWITNRKFDVGFKIEVPGPDGYPDSDKVGVLATFPAEGDGNPTLMRYIIRGQADMADYWEGE